MYYISKQFEVAGAHNLTLDYESKCSNIHGHNWIITVYCKSEKLDKNGMVIDFKKIKDIIHTKLDHAYLNEQFNFNPTAENIAKWICDKVTSDMDVGFCYKVSVQESQGNIAVYERDE